MRSGRTIAALTAALIASLTLGASAAGAAAPGPDAIAFQVDPAHDGALATGGPQPPLQQRWIRQFDTNLSYPLIVGGRVYVTSGPPGLWSGGTLYALDLATGQTLWSAPTPGTASTSHPAYDAGRVFVVGWDGSAEAYSAATGAVLWSSAIPTAYADASLPVAANGRLAYGAATTSDHQQTGALDEADGHVVWTAVSDAADRGTPATDGTTLFAASNGPNVDALALASGGAVWGYHPGGDGGGTASAVLADGRLFVSIEGDQGDADVFNASTGALIGNGAWDVPPAVSGSTGVFSYQGHVRAQDVQTGASLWTFTGDGSLVSAPVIGGDVVYLGSATGRLYALSLSSGAVLWSGEADGTIGVPQPHNAYDVANLQPGDGYLLVPLAGGALEAFAGSGGSSGQTGGSGSSTSAGSTTAHAPSRRSRPTIRVVIRVRRAPATVRLTLRATIGRHRRAVLARAVRHVRRTGRVVVRLAFRLPRGFRGSSAVLVVTEQTRARTVRSVRQVRLPR